MKRSAALGRPLLVAVCARPAPAPAAPREATGTELARGATIRRRDAFPRPGRVAQFRE